MKQRKLSLLVGLVLSVAGCSVRHHAEFRSGSGGRETAGGERPQPPRRAKPAPSAAPPKSAPRDSKVVRVRVQSGHGARSDRGREDGTVASRGGQPSRPPASPSSRPSPVRPAAASPPASPASASARPAAASPPASRAPAGGNSQPNVEARDGSGTQGGVASGTPSRPRPRGPGKRVFGRAPRPSTGAGGSASRRKPVVSAGRRDAPASSADARPDPNDRAPDERGNAARPNKPVARIGRAVPDSSSADRGSASGASGVRTRVAAGPKPGALADRPVRGSDERVQDIETKSSGSERGGNGDKRSVRAAAKKPAGVVRVATKDGVKDAKKCAPFVRKVRPGTLLKMRVSGVGSEGDVLLSGDELPVKSRGATTWTVSVPEGAKTGDLRVVVGGGSLTCGRLEIADAK